MPVNLEFADGPAISYEPYRPDDACYPDKQQEGAATRRNDTKRPYVDFGAHRHEDKERYTSGEVMALEWQRLWKKAWLIVGRTSDIQQPGDFMKVDIGHESILIVRDERNAIGAFFNVCQHRGTRLVTNDFGHQRRSRFTCPFHGWQFDLAGRCIKVTDRETFRKEALSYDTDIPSVKVAEWRGWLFLSMNKSAPPLFEFLGDDFMRDHDAHLWEQMVRVADVTQVWNVNWKIALEAFIEGYHVQGVHPQLIATSEHYRTQIDVYQKGHNRQIVPFLKPSTNFAYLAKDNLTDEHKLFLRDAGIDPETFKGSAFDVRSTVIAAKREYAKRLGYDFSRFDDEQLIDTWNSSVFPAASINCSPEGVLLQRWWPHPSHPEKMIYYSQVWSLPGSALPSYMAVSRDKADGVLGRTYLETGDLEPLGPVLSQDATFIPRVHASTHSDGFRGPLYSELELRIRHFYDEYYRHMNPE